VPRLGILGVLNHRLSYCGLRSEERGVHRPQYTAQGSPVPPHAQKVVHASGLLKPT